MSRFSVVILLLSVSSGLTSEIAKRDVSDVFKYFFREVCMDELGCFSNAPPFFNFPERPLSFIPEDRDLINTRFYLYTQTNSEQPQIFTNQNFTFWELFQAEFNPSVITRFIVPGFISRMAANWELPMKDAFLKSEGCNVFVVDWTGGDGPIYEQAVSNTRVVGAEIAMFITRLQDSAGIKPENIHIVGHSLGSHIAGYAGKRIEKLGRITAMDPAGPYFSNVDPLVRLDREDATFVDVIHTNAAPSRFTGFGLVESIGHFDFFPNGGHIQPGCEDMGHAILSFLSHPQLNIDGLSDLMCSHSRATTLFLSTIGTQECELKGTMCDSWDDYRSAKCPDQNSTSMPLGMPSENYSSLVHHNSSINFYLGTTDAAPFCLPELKN